MMQYAQQMGIDPQMIAQMVGGGQGGAPPMAAPPGNGQAGPPQGPQDMIPPGVPPMGDSPGAPMDEQQMINDEIDRKGATWDGQEAPTQNDIDRLQSDPSAINIKSFNAQFGEGAAEQVLGESGGGEEQGETSPDNESDEGDHEYR
jgi:hypothetical protein